MESATFAPVDGVRLEIRGSRRTLRHYRAEYGPTAVAGGAPPDLVLSFQSLTGPPMLQGGHKGLRWRIALSPPAAAPIEATVALGGEPRSFGLSLLQGYVIEPLLGVVAAERERVLLPGAAIEVGGRALLVLGRSRSGKSSVTALAAARGLPVLGDDHVVLGTDGGCSPFPRRLRLYPDIRLTAPAAYARLGGVDRARLHGLAAVRRATRGLVAPPLRVPVEALGARASTLPLGRIVVVERRAASEPERVTLGLRELVAAAGSILGEQRRSLDTLSDRQWLERIERARAAEDSLLERAFAERSPATLLVVPADWDATRTVGRLASELGLPN